MEKNNQRMNHSRYIKATACTLLMGLAVSSCSRTEDPIFSQSPNQRVQEVLLEAQTVLAKPANGWVMRIYPSADRIWGGYTVLVKFADDGTLVAASELFGASETFASNYKIDNSNLPTLTFDTFNKAIHLFSLPNLNYIIAQDKQERGDASRLGVFSGASTNKGLDGDYSYRIISATEGRVELEGARTATRIVLEPAPTTAWSEQLTAIQTASEQYVMPRVKLTIGSQTYSGRMRATTRQLRITDASGNVVLNSAYCYTGTGLRLYEPLTIDGVAIEEFVQEGEGSTIRLQTTDAKATLEPSLIPISELLAENQELWGIFAGGTLTGELSGRFTDAIDKFNAVRGTQYAVLDLDLGASTHEGFTDFGLYAILMDLSTYNIGVAYLPLKIQVDSDTEVTITFDPSAIKDEQRTLINDALASILAAGFANIGKVADTDGTVYYDEGLTSRSFTVETNSLSNPTWIKLIDKSDANNWVKLKRAVIVSDN